MGKRFFRMVEDGWGWLKVEDGFRRVKEGLGV